MPIFVKSVKRGLSLIAYYAIGKRWVIIGRFRQRKEGSISFELYMHDFSKLRAKRNGLW